jgi:hypothetical protein
MLSNIALAQSPPLRRQFKGTPGHDVNVGIFASMKSDCTAGKLPVVRLIKPPLHGKIVLNRKRLRVTNFKQCLATDLPAFVALYRSVPDFVGVDQLTLEVISANGKTQFQRITIILSKSGSGQPI